MVKHISGKELESLLSAGKPVVCDFWAAWCGPCRMLAPVFEEVAAKYEGQVEFVKIDVDEEMDAARKYGISSIPNVIAFKNGAPVDNHLGFAPEAVLTEFIERNL